MSRLIQKPRIEKYSGTWIKELGDGVLAIFNSAYDAVKCSIEIQKEVREKSTTQLRIGIHLGDITLENNDAFGDGVNIASRIQSIADPGSIFITENIENAIRSRTDIHFKYLGEVQLKNVDYPVRTYAIQGDGLPVLSISGLEKSANRRRGTGRKQIRSLVVLPFTNLTGSEEKEYLAAGIHDALISELSHINNLRVTSRTSAMQYRHSGKTIPQIANELSVDAIVETSVMRADDSIRLNVQLIKALPEEDHIWAQYFDRELKNILPMVSEVTQQIADKIKINLSPAVKKLISKDRPVDPEIYKLYLKGKFELNKQTPESFQAGIEYLNQVIAIDPVNALAYATLSMGYGDLAHLPPAPQDAFPRAKVLAGKALELDETLAGAQTAMAEACLYYDWDFKTAKKYFTRALELDPNFAPAVSNYGWWLDLVNRKEEAEKHLKLACELDPFATIYRIWLAWWYWGAVKKYELGIREIRRVLELESNNPLAIWVMGGIYADMCNFDEAIPLHKKASGLSDQFKWSLAKTYALAGKRSEALAVLSEVEESPINAFGLAQVYATLRDEPNTLKWAEVLYNIRHPFVPWFAGSFFDLRLHKNSRYKEITGPIAAAITAAQTI